MICDICQKNEAIIFVEQTGRDGVRKINICASCAAERGIPMDGSSVEKALGSIFSELAGKLAGKAAEDKACPVCGQRLSKFRFDGHLGCPECYAIFKDEICAFLKKRGVSGKYTGSMPRRLATFRSVLTDRADVKLKLDAAIEKEDYEKAAFYRDYLHAIENRAVSTYSEEDEDEKAE